MLAILGGITWLFPETLKPELTWLRSAGHRRTLFGHGPFSMFQRTRRVPKGAFKAFSDKEHRNAAYRIAGVPGTHEDPEADKLGGPATAAIIVYPSVEDLPDGGQGEAIDPANVRLGFHIITPLSSAPTDGRLIKWTVVDSGNRSAVVVDASG